MKENNAPAVGRTPFQKWLDKYQGLFYLIPWIIGFVVFKARTIPITGQNILTGNIISSNTRKIALILIPICLVPKLLKLTDFPHKQKG